MSIPLIDVIPPEWCEPEAPDAEPSTGYLSPEGRLYACPPWGHALLAGDLAQAGRRALSRELAYSTDSGDLLLRAGWLHIGRRSAVERERTGGTFTVRGSPNDTQATVLLAWMERGATTVQVSTIKDRERGLYARR